MQEATDPPDVPQFSLGRRMRAAMEDAGINNIEMARYLEVGANTISNWLNGRTRPTALYLRQFALRCGVEYEWLVGEDRPRTERGGSRSSRLIPKPRPVRVLQGIAIPAAAVIAEFVNAGGLPGT